VSLGFSPDGKVLAWGGTDEVLRLLDVAGAPEGVTLKGHAGQVCCVAFSPDGRTLVSGDTVGALKLWEVPPAVKAARRDRETGLAR
jgi:WD40 repeat protein